MYAETVGQTLLSGLVNAPVGVDACGVVTTHKTGVVGTCKPVRRAVNIGSANVNDGIVEGVNGYRHVVTALGIKCGERRTSIGQIARTVFPSTHIIIGTGVFEEQTYLD